MQLSDDQILKNIVRCIQDNLPMLHMHTHLDENNHFQQLAIPEQEALNFELKIVFEQSELTLLAPEFHWHFSLQNHDDLNLCIGTVIRLATGKSRLKLTTRRKTVTKTELQNLDEHEWVTVMTTGVFTLPSFGKDTIRYIRNSVSDQ